MGGEPISLRRGGGRAYAIKGLIPRAISGGQGGVAQGPRGLLASDQQGTQQGRLGPGEAVGLRPPPRGGSSVRPPAQDYWRNSQFGAGARGAGDALTFGLADNASAGVRALLDGGLDGAAQRYQSNMDEERAQDRYDEAHYGGARTAGQVAGTVAQIAALGPMDGLVAGGVRLAETAPMIAREAAVLGGGGGALGVGNQALSDFQARRLGTLGDYAGAGAGGAFDALASAKFGPGKGGAIGGAATSMLQDVFNGRNVSVSDARRAALAGQVLGGTAGMAGRKLSDSLSILDKGRLGEDLSKVRTWARGDSTLPGAKRSVRLADGRRTIPDSRTKAGELVESKFGRGADLTTNQRAAFHQPLSGFRVDHFLPADIGAIFGLPAGLLALPHSRADRDF